MQDRAIAEDLFCPECGYNLRGLTGDRCPECGELIDLFHAAEPQLPWAHRAQLGRFRAYWRTVALVMFKGKRFCAEIARPVSYPDSQSFRWITIAYAFTPVALLCAWLYWILPENPFGHEILDDAWGMGWPILVTLLCLLLFLAGATGIPSYFFHPRSLPVRVQNRAIALSYYACGYLAVTGLSALSAGVAAFAEIDTRFGVSCLAFAVLATLAQWLGWWIDILRLMRRLLPQRRLRRFTAAFLIPLFWALLAGLTFFGVGFIAGYLWLILSSLS